MTADDDLTRVNVAVTKSKAVARLQTSVSAVSHYVGEGDTHAALGCIEDAIRDLERLRALMRGNQ